MYGLGRSELDGITHPPDQIQMLEARQLVNRHVVRGLTSVQCLALIYGSVERLAIVAIVQWHGGSLE